MPDQPFEHQPLENLMLGVEESGLPDSSAEITAELKDRGIDAGRITSSIKLRVEEKLQRRRLEKERQRDLARNVSIGSKIWTHPSVKRFAQGGDPVERIIELANSWVLEFREENAENAAIDPFAIAQWRSIPVRARDNVADARTIPIPGGTYEIEYNPHRSKARMRFSIAHELAHTFFDDCHEMIRNRASRDEMLADEWQLEMLCNLGAAELLMPIATFPEIKQESLLIDHLLDLRKRYEVGIESLLLRIVRLTTSPCAIFAASKRVDGVHDDGYKIDYILGSRTWHPPVSSGDILSSASLVTQCKAIGFTAKGDEYWPNIAEKVHVECVGIPPYPGHRFPRVAGIFSPATFDGSPAAKLTEVIGNALEPRGTGAKVLAYIVNDGTPNWGAGFARKVAGKWPTAQNAFRQWVASDRKLLSLGKTFEIREHDVWLVPMICQRGYGASPQTRIRYGALKECLDQVARLAHREKAAVHMPRLGSGYSRGLWPVIAQIVDETLCFQGLNVTIYNLPDAKPESAPELPGLFKGRTK